MPPPPPSSGVAVAKERAGAAAATVAASPRDTESMALTSTIGTTASGPRSASGGSVRAASPLDSPSSHHLAVLTSTSRKRARDSAGGDSAGGRSSSRSPAHLVSTDAPQRTLPPQRHSAGWRGGDSSGTPPLWRGTAPLGTEEVFLESDAPARASSTPLQHTPNSQLLSQQQAPPYAAPSDDPSDAAAEEPAVEHALFTPATVARRPPQVQAAHRGVADARAGVAASSAASPATSSASRPSSHDETVQAILRANPPTTTRPVQLRPGYALPSPQSPLWTALEDDAGDVTSARDSATVLAEPPLADTQVSLFLTADEDDNADDDGAARPPRAAAHHVLTATHERRRLGTRSAAAAAGGRISLPLPGRSLNLLEDDGLHDDERPPLFVGDDGDDAAPFSLTQEANRQERGLDLQAALPRSRARRRGGVRGAGSDAPAAAATAPARPHSTPGAGLSRPAHHLTTRSRAAAHSHQTSPYSQLQRDVESTAAAAGDGAGPVAAARPSAAPSQKELRRRAEMLMWAERTRAFFHYIDTRPLHVTTSPLKPAASTPSIPRRVNRSESVAAAAVAARRSAATTSTSLVRRSRSASTLAPASSHPVPHRSSSSAFEAVLSRVRRETAAATATRRSTAL
ncbi:hypothetical protein NESM_000383100 [Novymonas esmeraldas]|uniref:Uncharacterized protein n=1 Tax=Novymonas esmeraldas TaxID=1808958 RepID=A0AAW0EKQ8_9TRYP